MKSSGNYRTRQRTDKELESDETLQESNNHNTISASVQELDSPQVTTTYEKTALKCAPEYGDSETHLGYLHKSDNEKTVSEVDTYLRENLPAYCLPDKITQTDVIPMTTHGKVDRRKLTEQLQGNGRLVILNRTETK